MEDGEDGTAASYRRRLDIVSRPEARHRAFWGTVMMRVWGAAVERGRVAGADGASYV